MDIYAQKGRHPHASSEALFTKSLALAFDEIPNFFKKFTNYDRDLNAIKDLVLTCGDPTEYFDYIGHGAYKEVYSLPNLPDYVLKLCSQRNDTESERALLDLAKQEGLAFAFVPTYFVPLYGLTCDMPELLRNKEEEGCSIAVTWNSKYSKWTNAPDWDGRYCTYLEIQSYVEPANDAYINPDKNIIADPYTGEIISSDLVWDLGIYNEKWLTAFLKYYGRDNLEKLADFVARYRISDLHNRNLGYLYNGEETPRPVILDWLSPSADRLSRLCYGPVAPAARPVI